MKRAKRRYLALQLDLDCLPSEKEFMDVVWGAVTKLYGEYGASLTSMVLIDYDVEGKSAILRTSLVTEGLVRAALASIVCALGKDATIHVVAVSGTIKALRANLKA